MTTNLAAITAGIMLGVLAALIWNTVSARLGRIEFWPEFSSLARSLLAADDNRDFLSQYGQLLKLSLRYVGRNLLLTVASSLPVLLCVWFLATPAFERYREGENGVVDPSPRPTVSISGPPSAMDHDSTANMLPRVDRTPGNASERFADVSMLSKLDPEYSFYTAVIFGSVAAMITFWKRR